MLELDDEPADVQNATPVEDEVRQGEVDEILSRDAMEARKKLDPQQPVRHRCRKNVCFKPPAKISNHQCSRLTKDILSIT